jgi:ribosomal protein S18 acetylase RimI-like enzyme
VATHPTHQGRGLARALVCAGMRLLATRGGERAVLGTSSDNLAMQATAQSVGYRVESERAWFSWRAPAASNAR